MVGGWGYNTVSPLVWFVFRSKESYIFIYKQKILEKYLDPYSSTKTDVLLMLN